MTAEALLNAEPRTVAAELATRRAALSPDASLEATGLLTGELDVAAVVSGGRAVGLARAADAALVVRHAMPPQPNRPPRRAMGPPRPTW